MQLLLDLMHLVSSLLLVSVVLATTGIAATDDVSTNGLVVLGISTLAGATFLVFLPLLLDLILNQQERYESVLLINQYFPQHIKWKYNR